MDLDKMLRPVRFRVEHRRNTDLKWAGDAPWRPQGSSDYQLSCAPHAADHLSTLLNGKQTTEGDGE
jgi:hypothetical protein